MKLICFSFFLLALFSTGLKGQDSSRAYTKDSVLMMLAENGKHNRLYGDLRALKIHYRFDSQIFKAKGKLLVRNEVAIQLKPFGHKDIVIIPVDSIVSIIPWHRKEKTFTAVSAGTGVAAFFGAAFLQSPPGVTKINIPQAFLLSLSLVTTWLSVMMLPVDYLGEWLFIRSEKKGYHFSIEKIPLEKGFWGENLIPKKLSEH